jgi:hypothetical protein
MYVSSNFRGMLQVFHFDVAKVDLDVAMAIHVHSKCLFKMFHLFQKYITSVLPRYCSGYTHMLQTYVPKMFICLRRMLQQVFHVSSVYA